MHGMGDVHPPEVRIALLEALAARAPGDLGAGVLCTGGSEAVEVALKTALLATGRPGFVPCTPLGCMMLLKDQISDLTGSSAVVVGRSNIVGKPMGSLLLAEHCTVTIAHSRTRNLDDVCRKADILIAAVGRPQMIPGDWVKPGAVVIDVGINRIDSESGKTRLVGDVDFDSASEVAGAITPVPGGVGPMTIACLLRNTVQAACAAGGITFPLT